MKIEGFGMEVGQYQLKATWFLPEGEVIGTAQLLHGQGDFIKRYKEVARLFCARGIAVCGVDLPGHGESNGKRGDIPSLSLVDEIITLTQKKIEQRYPLMPRGLMAHSMGGLLGLRLLTQRPDYYDFCWLSSPLLNPGHGRPLIARKLLELIEPLFPKVLIDTGVRRALCRRIPEHAQLHHKPHSHFHKKISLRWGKALLRAASEISPEKTSLLTTSTLLTQGEKDTVTPLKYALEFFHHQPWSSLEMQVIQNALHEPFRDLTKEECFSVIEAWLSSLFQATLLQG